MVKGNSPKLFEAPGALDWAAVPVSHQVTGTGHGRREKRTSQVMDAPDHIRAVFPHARQVFLIERYVTRKVRKRKKNSRRYKTTEVRTAVAALGITSLSAREAAPVHLAGYIRGHWSIENKIHWSVLRGAPACRMTWHRKLHGELLQHTSRGVVLVVAAGLTLAVSGHAPWCNTCGVTTPC